MIRLTLALIVTLTVIVLIYYNLNIVGNSKAFVIKKYKWTTEDVNNYFNLNPEDSFFINKAINDGVFRPDDSCNGNNIVVYKKLVRTNTNQELEAIFHDSVTFNKLEKLAAYLYKTVPEIYIDTGINYSFNYRITNRSVIQNLNSAKKGELAALCYQYSEFTKTLWELFNKDDKNLKVRICSMEPPKYGVNHTVAVFYYINDRKLFGVASNGMYGYTYPYSDEAGYIDINELKCLNDKKSASELSLHYIDSSSLNKKRFLTNKIWPCNIVNDKLVKYFQLPKNALTRFELNEPENIGIIFSNGYDLNDYKLDLSKLIIENQPDSW